MKPLMDFIVSEERASKHGETVTVVISQFVITKWWHNILHNQTAYFIKSVLYKNRNVAVLTVPYIIEEVDGTIYNSKAQTRKYLA